MLEPRNEKGCSRRFSPVSFWRFIAIGVLVTRNRVVMDASFVLLRRPEPDTRKLQRNAMEGGMSFAQ